MIAHRDYETVVPLYLKMDMLQSRISTERDTAEPCAKRIGHDVSLSAPAQKNTPYDVCVST